MQPTRANPTPTQVLKDAQLALQVALAVAGPGLASALSYLELVAENAVLPDEVRARAREAALRLAEAAVHLECLPEMVEFNVIGPQPRS